MGKPSDYIIDDKSLNLTIIGKKIRSILKFNFILLLKINR